VSQPGFSAPPFVHQDSRGLERFAWTNGQEATIVLDGEQTDGLYSVVDAHTRRGDATPVHVHRKDDEAFFLLDGAMTAWVGDERHELQAGGIVFLPRNIPHAIRFDVASRVLMFNWPAGPQTDMIRAAGWDLREPLPPGWQVSLDALREASQRSGVELLGPPHSLSD
jgi:quercetin dioxygenase-like cupin family protein